MIIQSFVKYYKKGYPYLKTKRLSNFKFKELKLDILINIYGKIRI